MHAVAHALTVLGWFELSEEDRPPERIWLDDEALSEHFDRVSNRHLNGAGAGVEAPDSDDLTRNELTAGFKR